MAEEHTKAAEATSGARARDAEPRFLPWLTPEQLREVARAGADADEVSGVDDRDLNPENLSPPRPRRACSTCTLWSVPQWDTADMGTCSLPSKSTRLRVIGGGYVTTHATHLCSGWEERT